MYICTYTVCCYTECSVFLKFATMLPYRSSLSYQSSLGNTIGMCKYISIKDFCVCTWCSVDIRYRVFPCSELCSYCASWFIGILSIIPTHVRLQGQLACESLSLSLSLFFSLSFSLFPLPSPLIRYLSSPRTVAYCRE